MPIQQSWSLKLKKSYLNAYALLHNTNLYFAHYSLNLDLELAIKANY